MARPKSDGERTAILDTATLAIAAQGPGAPTSVIAREAGISNGSLFTYFATKSRQAFSSALMVVEVATLPWPV